MYICINRMSLSQNPTFPGHCVRLWFGRRLWHDRPVHLHGSPVCGGCTTDCSRKTGNSNFAGLLTVLLFGFLFASQVACYDYDSDGSHDLIGTFTTSFVQLTSAKSKQVGRGCFVCLRRPRSRNMRNMH